MTELDLTLESTDDVDPATDVADDARVHGGKSEVVALPMLTDSEFWQVLKDWNQTVAEYPKDRCVHELVEAQAERSPDAMAVVSDRGALTYRELNERANRLAHHLQGLGVGPDTLVAICAERSLEMIVGLLGILKAGGAYVPLDPAYPRERLAFMVRDSGAPVLLTQERLHARLRPEGASCRMICLDADEAMPANAPTTNPASGATPDRLAYVIYTSGTTGEPKGVELTHGGLLNLIFWHRQAYRVGPDDKATHLAGVGFDAAVWELWPYLTAGACLHLPDDETRMAPEKLRDWIASRAITLTFVPTPMAEKLVALPWPEKLALRAMLTGGDRLTCEVSPGLPFPLVNHYGPTENTVVTTCGTVEASRAGGKAPPIGKPIANTQVYLLDEKQKPVPVGTMGEIYIGGDGLARGYHRRPELTAEKFIANPFSGHAGGRLYKSGDLARYLPTGELEFLGRNDDQVKLRGYRIELGEIEMVLARHPGVAAAVVLARTDGASEKRLVAYVTTREPVPTVSGLRDHLKKLLPDYMVPATFVMLAEFPLTANGKIDRSALPAPETSSAAVDEEDAATSLELEQTVARIVGALLKVKHVDAQANFFDLGGHSLLATQLIARVRDEFGVDLPLRIVFEAPTVSELAAEIKQMLVDEIAAMSDEELQRLLDHE